jgi:alpha-L-fucosidase
VYFSPDDFRWLRENGITIQRGVDAVQPRNNPDLMRLNQEQMRELMTGYGRIDMVFLDGEPDGLHELAWQLQPETVVTRGAMKTPEQHIPGTALDEAWESCLTMGTQWQYKPTNETCMTGGEIIAKLVETRAKGGNLLLNVSPRPDGELPMAQEERLRELALWMFVNSECIHGVRPWIVTHEKDLWFTHNRRTGSLYVIVKGGERWKHGKWRELVLRSVKATSRTTASVLGQNDKALEYRPAVTPQTTFRQTADGLHIRAMRAQRLYNDRAWPNPVVIRLTHVEPALVPPRVETLGARWDTTAGAVELRGRLTTAEDAAKIGLAAQYRDITGLDVNERLDNWVSVPGQSRAKAGDFTLRFGGLKGGRTYEIRTFANHPLLEVYGNAVRLNVP